MRHILYRSGELFGMALSPGPCEDSSWATAVFRLNLGAISNALEEKDMKKNEAYPLPIW